MCQNASKEVFLTMHKFRAVLEFLLRERERERERETHPPSKGDGLSNIGYNMIMVWDRRKSSFESQ